MKQFIVKENEAGQRLDRFLEKYLKEASKGFLYKMLRKKNITVNNRKADPSERIGVGDCIQFFFSDETFQKFRGRKEGAFLPDGREGALKEGSPYIRAFQRLNNIGIIYENEHVIFLNKPAGILTQKAEAADDSLNEWLIGYLLAHGKMEVKQLETFKPSVCNRLDRNTSGLVICGKTLAGSRKMSQLIRDREVRKFYRTVVKGRVEQPLHLKGFLKKDAKTNRVVFKDRSAEGDCGFEPVETKAVPLSYCNGCTCLEVELITGKTHQIRAHLSHLGHPILGDPKYGDREFNHRVLGQGETAGQFLHSFRLEFPVLKAPFEELSEKSFIAPQPKLFERFGSL